MSFVGPLGLLFSLPLSAVLVRLFSQIRNSLLSDTVVKGRDVITMSLAFSSVINRSNLSWQSCRHVGCGSNFVLYDSGTLSISWGVTAGYL